MTAGRAGPGPGGLARAAGRANNAGVFKFSGCGAAARRTWPLSRAVSRHSRGCGRHGLRASQAEHSESGSPAGTRDPRRWRMPGESQAAT